MNKSSNKRVIALCVTLLIGLIGTYFLISSHAATPYASVQVDSGALADGAIKLACIGASDGSCIKFNGLNTNPSGAGIGEMALDSGQQNYLGSTKPYTYVILQDSMASSIAAIHANNPNTKVLVYENSAFISNNCSNYPNIDSPMDTCQADSNTQWYIDQNGAPFAACDFAGQYWANIGNISYQQTWLADASALAKKDGFDGIFMDDTNTHPGHCEDGALPTYSDTAYGNAMLGFLKYEYAGLHSNGLLVVPNVSANAWDNSQESIEEAMAPYTNAVFQEMFMNYNLSSPALFSTNNWLAVMHQMINVSKVTGYYANTYDSSFNTQTMAYARASFLLGWNGGTSSAFQFHINNSNTTDSYNSVWAASVGQPTNSYYELSDGVYRRDFSGGIVLVNPSPSATETLVLGGTYTDTEDNSQLSSVTLKPTSGVILSN
jgi:hypothetical protein